MRYSLVLFCILLNCTLSAQQAANPDSVLKTKVLVIGGGTGGTAAAIQCARMGVSTILVEPTKVLGGMLTAAGVSCTDGNDIFAGGIWEEFRQALYRHYRTGKLNTGWVSNTCFEPHTGDSIFRAMAGKENKLQVLYENSFYRVLKRKGRVSGACFFNERTGIRTEINAEVVIDATETGDVLAASGALYDLGTDDPAASGEKEARQKTNIIQDLTWVAILKDYGPGTDKTITKPPGYSAGKYYCCNTNAPCTGTPWNGSKTKMLNYAKLPRSPGATADKYMINWPAHGNDFYLNVVELEPGMRRSRYDSAINHTLGFIYFIQTELGMKNLGLADDELNNGIALIPYNREGRRVRGMVRLQIDHLKEPYRYTLYRTGIAAGNYPVDHHHAKYPGKVPEIDFPPIPAYTIPLGALIPGETDGLIVCEKGISVTNIVNGTTRLQPVVLQTGQAAGVLAALSVKEKKQPRQANIQAVQEVLLKARCYLMPFTDIRPDDPHWEAIQRTGLTGVLKGTGKPEGWANKMLFYPDSLLMDEELTRGISGYFGSRGGFRLPPEKELTIAAAFRKIKAIAKYWRTAEFYLVTDEAGQARKWKEWGLTEFDPHRLIRRREICVLLDHCFQLAGNRNLQLDMNGKIRMHYSQF